MSNLTTDVMKSNYRSIDSVEDTKQYSKSMNKNYNFKLKNILKKDICKLYPVKCKTNFWKLKDFSVGIDSKELKFNFGSIRYTGLEGDKIELLEGYLSIYCNLLESEKLTFLKFSDISEGDNNEFLVDNIIKPLPMKCNIEIKREFKMSIVLDYILNNAYYKEILDLVVNG